MTKLVLILVFLSLAGVAFSQNTCYVNTTGVDANAACSSASPCATISYCLASFAAQNSFVINLAPGQYDADNCNVTLSQSSSTRIVIEASQPNTVFISCWNTTSIRHFTFADMPNTEISLNNLNLTNGSGGNGGCVYASNIKMLNVSNTSFMGCNAAWGGAVYSESNVTIANATFSKNTAGNGGGALYLTTQYNFSSISQSIITQNLAGFGGGIYLLGDYLTMSNSNVTFNIATRNGGAVYLVSNTPTHKGKYNFVGSLLTNNTAQSGGGIFSENLNHTWNVFGAYLGSNIAIDNNAADNNVACNSTGSVFCFACLALDCVNGCPIGEVTSCSQNATSAFCYSTGYNSCDTLACKCKAKIKTVEKVLIAVIGVLLALGITLVAVDVVRHLRRKRSNENTYTPIK